MAGCWVSGINRRNGRTKIRTPCEFGGETDTFPNGDAQSDALSTDSDLVAIIAAWPALSRAAKKRIMAELRKPRRKR